MQTVIIKLKTEYSARLNQSLPKPEFIKCKEHLKLIVNCYQSCKKIINVQHLSMVTKIKDSKYGIVWSFHRDVANTIFLDKIVKV